MSGFQSSLGMMRFSGFAALCLVVAACTAGESVTTSTINGTSVSELPKTATTATPLTQTEGRLPDGREYLLESDVAVSDPEAVYAVIEVVIENAPITGEDIGCSTCTQPVLGITTFSPRSGQDPEYENGVYTASSGSWTMRIVVYDFILEAWGDRLEADLLHHIRPINNESGLPSFHLSGPFEWAEDPDVPAYMEVFYSNFVVRRGCEGSSVSCSTSEAVQVIPVDEVIAPAPSWNDSWSIVISDLP